MLGRASMTFLEYESMHACSQSALKNPLFLFIERCPSPSLDQLQVLQSEPGLILGTGNSAVRCQPVVDLWLVAHPFMHAQVSRTEE